MGSVKGTGQETQGSAMIAYFETAGILFCEIMIAYATINAILKTLTYIWEKLK